MKKFFSLLRAVMSQDMQMFRFKAKNNATGIKKAIIPILLAALVLYAVGTMYLPLAMELNEANALYILLEFAIAIPSFIALLEGAYKSQTILFDAKDNELLFSLPVSKKMVLASRVIKLYVFQFLYSLLFCLPGIAIYAYYQKPTLYFYIITAIILILFPIIPSILGCVIGYITKQISSKFKAKKTIQLIITMAFVSLIMVLSFNANGIVSGIVEKADSIDIAIKNYFPIKAYIDLLSGFDIVKLLLLIGINVAFAFFFIIIFGRHYFDVITRSRSNIRSSNKEISVEDFKYKKQSILTALIKKEFSKYFSSTIYMFNTLFGLVLLLIATVALCMNFEQAINYMASGEMPVEDIATLRMLAPNVFITIVIAMSFMTSITSSSISIEGKTFNISKSLPVMEDKMLLAKVLMSNIITIPVILICDIIFFCSFKVEIIEEILILITSVIAPSIAAVFGLIINLKFPKMDASSDAEVVKQSMSSMVSVFGGMILAGVFVALTFLLAAFGSLGMLIEVVLLAIILLILWIILSLYGKKRYKQIEA